MTMHITHAIWTYNGTTQVDSDIYINNLDKFPYLLLEVEYSGIKILRNAAHPSNNTNGSCIDVGIPWGATSFNTGIILSYHRRIFTYTNRLHVEHCYYNESGKGPATNNGLLILRSVWGIYLTRAVSNDNYLAQNAINSLGGWPINS